MQKTTDLSIICSTRAKRLIKGAPTAAADSRHTCEAKGDNCAVKKFKRYYERGGRHQPRRH
ncbi:MAG: hypothetical protein L6V93_14105 [Clostridiales bacterium]|nr:MAG: hypothetical protein L6V93_14105 [Clostridiales bacterium]